MSITSGYPVQESLYRSEELLIEGTCTLTGAKHLGAEHWHESKGCGSRDNHNDADYPTELLEHNSSHSLNHSQRQEHAEHSKSGCHYGDRHLGGAVNGSFLRFLSSFQVSGYVLEHHYGIIHHHTYRYGKRGHRYDVQSVARGKEIDQRTQQGDWDTEDYYEGHSPSAQEEEDHQHYHQEGDKDSILQRVDGIDDIGRRVIDYLYLYVGRKAWLYLLKLFLNVADYVHRVRTILLLNNDTGTTLSVRIGLLLPLLLPIYDGGHIP